MSRLTGIATTCDIDRDPEQNRANHQAMIDTLNTMAAQDGWPGVKVTAFFNRGAIGVLQVEPGVAPLTLEYLRRMKEASNSNHQPTTPPVKPGEQGRLI